MARLEAMSKMGYYPTPEQLTPVIARYLKPNGKGLIRVFDPCAGEGSALKTIGDHLQAETYGIEIDRQRGRIARQKLTQCLITDYHAAQISPKFASLLWLNPPYDWSAREEEIERSERYERTFLRDTVKYLIPSGILVYLIPIRRLDATIARMLSYRFEKIQIYKFPEELFSQFKQIILFGVCKKTPFPDERIFEYLKEAGQGRIAISFLPEVPDSIYGVPTALSLQQPIFRTSVINPKDLEGEIQSHGIQDEIRKITTPLAAAGRMTSVMPLRHGHLAQMIACGFIGGVVFDRNNQNPLIVKGITKKVVDLKIEKEGDLERHIETDRIVITINAFNQSGELITIE
jgi:hypothetical protein